MNAGSMKDWTAYHEAGHAVIAHHFNAKLKGIQLEHEKAPCADWLGSAQVDCSGLDRRTISRSDGGRARPSCHVKGTVRVYPPGAEL